MSAYKEEDLATPEFIKEYLKEFREGIAENPQYQLDEKEKLKVQDALNATEKFSLGLISGKKKLYMHDLILMAIGFYGGYLTALDCLVSEDRSHSHN
jgi:hypothetical protein